MYLARVCQSLLLAILLMIPVMSSADENDPWEGFNRGVFVFNERLDQFILRPVAVAYGVLTPEPIDRAITRVFSNTGEPFVIINDLAQLKFHQAVSDTVRFLINTTLGFFGMFDVAAPLGFAKHNEDFGQTLGYWGVGTGPYLVLPFLGPKTLRSFTGDIADRLIDVGGNRWLYSDSEQETAFVLRSVDLRSDLIPSEGLVMGDKYIFMRSIYLQRREYLVNDGIVFDDFDDDF